ncbi:MAG: hypothetical protein R3C05_00395 [Pirellulaceae bacterium]
MMRLHRNEDGMIVWGVVVSVLFFMGMAAFVFNTGKTVTKKLETQNASDAIAYSSAVWTARGMNMLTASNHLIGELNGIYVLHHALGGRHLDQHWKPNEDPWEVVAMSAALNASVLSIGGVIEDLGRIDLGPLGDLGLDDLPFLGMEGFDTITGGIYSDLNSSIFQAKMVLQAQMLLLYVKHLKKLIELVKTIKDAIQALSIPVIGWAIAAGLVVKAIQIINEIQELRRKERSIESEYKRLNLLERIAKAASYPKKLIPGLIWGLHKIQQGVVNVMPTTINRMVETIGDYHKREAFIVGGHIFQNGVISNPLSTIVRPQAVMPVERELEYGTQNFNEEQSQMIRATYPWVVHWRKFIGLPLTLISHRSLIGAFYLNWTERYTIQASEFLRASDVYKDELTVINSRRTNHPHFGETIDGIMGMVSGLFQRVLGRNSPDVPVQGKDVRMYVVRGLNEKLGKKGTEVWNDANNQRAASRRADDLFTHLALAKTDGNSKLAGATIFRQEHPSGIMCVSQSMVYNANMLRDLNDSEQPKVTWDTLGWVGRVDEYESTWIGTALLAAIGDLFQGFAQPKIRLNWQAKLTPVTERKLKNASTVIGRQNRDVRDVMRPFSDNAAKLMNH